MLSRLNTLVRTRAAPFHHLLKNMAAAWMLSEEPAIPAFRIFKSKLLRLHPKLLTQDLNSVEPEVMEWIHRTCLRGSTVYDIGANIGLHAIFMAKLTGPGGRVIAFEPSPPNLRIIEYHKRMNKLNHLEVHRYAVSDVDQTHLPFFLLNAGDHSGNSLTFGRKEVPNLDRELHQNQREIDVECVSVDGFARRNRHRPQLIKIDVEGAELLVLKGASQTLAECRPIVILAIHPWWLPKGQTPDDVVSFLSSHGYLIKDKAGKLTRMLDYGEYLCHHEANNP
jgi:FkbM family methyltransferase